MDVRVVDLPALSRRSPDQVGAYLSANGWRIAGQQRGATYWHKVDGNYEVMVPSNQSVDSYGSYVASAIGVIAEAQDRTEVDVLLAMSQIEFDRQIIRSLVPDAGGSIAMTDGVAELNGVQAWLLAAAGHLAQREKRSVLSSKRSVAAQRFIERVRLGIPVEGSYVWSVLVPVAGQTADEPIYGIEMGDDDQLFPAPRQVTRVLYNATALALQTARNVVANDRYDVDTFRGLAESGVTANLCQALADLGGEQAIPYEIRFDWGVSLPEAPRPTIRAGVREMDVLEAVAKDLRASEPIPDMQVEGLIVRLHREGSLGPGEVSILGSAVGVDSARLGRYWVALSESDYDLANRAHIEGTPVRVRGTFREQAQRKWVHDPYGFELVPIEEFGD